MVVAFRFFVTRATAAAFCLFIQSTLLWAESGTPVQLLAAADPWPPYIDEHHPMGGVAVALADAAFRTQGYTVRNRLVPWARALEETRAGRNDLILDAWWSQERSVQFMYSMPFLDGPLKFIRHKNDPFEFHDLSSLTGKSVGMVRNYAYGDELMSLNTYDKVDLTEFMQGVKMLALRRINLAIENELVARTRILQDAPELLPQLEFVEPAVNNNFIYVIAGYAHPNHVEMIAAFNAGLRTILKNGTYHKILSDHGLAIPEMFKHQAKSAQK